MVPLYLILNDFYKQYFNFECHESFLWKFYKQHFNSEYVMNHSSENSITTLRCHALQFTCIIAFDPHSCCEEQPIIIPIW